MFVVSWLVRLDLFLWMCEGLLCLFFPWEFESGVTAGARSIFDSDVAEAEAEEAETEYVSRG